MRQNRRYVHYKDGKASIVRKSGISLFNGLDDECVICKESLHREANYQSGVYTCQNKDCSRSFCRACYQVVGHLMLRNEPEIVNSQEKDEVMSQESG